MEVLCCLEMLLSTPRIICCCNLPDHTVHMFWHENLILWLSLLFDADIHYSHCWHCYLKDVSRQPSQLSVQTLRALIWISKHLCSIKSGTGNHSLWMIQKLMAWYVQRENEENVIVAYFSVQFKTFLCNPRIHGNK